MFCFDNPAIFLKAFDGRWENNLEYSLHFSRFNEDSKCVLFNQSDKNVIVMERKLVKYGLSKHTQ